MGCERNHNCNCDGTCRVPQKLADRLEDLNAPPSPRLVALEAALEISLIRLDGIAEMLTARMDPALLGVLAFIEKSRQEHRAALGRAA